MSETSTSAPLLQVQHLGRRFALPRAGLWRPATVLQALSVGELRSSLEPGHELLADVFKELSVKDKGAAKLVREKLDEAKRALTGSEQIAYHNNSPDTLSYLWVQLDQNIYKKDSDARMILESELKKAEARQAELLKEYNGGVPEKLGPETRNNQKYIDRVAELKAAIARADAAATKLKAASATLVTVRPR